MKKLKKRKSNPNKLPAYQVRLLQKEADERRKQAEAQQKRAEFMQLCEEDCKHVYEMDMTFYSTKVHEYVETQKIEQATRIAAVENPTSMPYNILLGAYDYQDLAVALVMEHLQTPEEWRISAEGYFLDVNDPDAPLVTHDFFVTLPSMHHSEIWKGKDKCPMPQGHGLKVVRKWEGLQQELIKHFAAKVEAEHQIDNYQLETIQVHLEADAKFKNADTYAEFLTIQECVKAGTADRQMYQLWLMEQMKIKELEQQRQGNAA